MRKITPTHLGRRRAVDSVRDLPEPRRQRNAGQHHEDAAVVGAHHVDDVDQLKAYDKMHARVCVQWYRPKPTVLVMASGTLNGTVSKMNRFSSVK